MGEAGFAWAGFGVSTFNMSVSREQFEGGLDSNFLTKIIKGPALRLYDFVEENPTSTVALVAGHNTLGSIAALKNKNLSPKVMAEIKEKYSASRYQPIDAITLDENGNVVDAVGKANKVALALLPGFSLAYYITPQFKIFGRVGYLMAQTDDIDAFNLPVAANQGRDIIQVNHLGFGYQLYRKKFY